MKGLLPPMAAAMLGAVWCLWRVGVHAVDPTHIAWTLQGDWAMAQPSQSFFREEPWRWPLGTVTAVGLRELLSQPPG